MLDAYIASFISHYLSLSHIISHLLILQDDERKFSADRLEQALLVSTFVGGHVSPSKVDAAALSALLAHSGQADSGPWLESASSQFPNTVRWVRHMASYSPEERAAWA